MRFQIASLEALNPVGKRRPEKSNQHARANQKDRNRSDDRKHDEEHQALTLQYQRDVDSSKRLWICRPVPIKPRCGVVKVGVGHVKRLALVNLAFGDHLGQGLRQRHS